MLNGRPMEMLFLYFLAWVICMVQCSSVQVHTALGDIIGLATTVTSDGKTNQVNYFTAIPYAEAPTGNNRFKKPVPKAPFISPYNATRPAPACFQYGYTFPPEFVPVSEDCLYLNVYVPGDLQRVKSIPVMIWIHGGSYIAGTSAEYDPTKISLLGNVIVVTINYRLGVFGFLQSFDGKLIGNQGLWDQHLAIKWVYNNIASFHGNPDMITIFGESAGAGSVVHQMLYQGNAGTFRRAIAQSGSPLEYKWYTTKSNSELVAKLTGCDHGPLEPADCLRSMSAETLNNVTDDNLYYEPFLDGDFVIEKPYDIIYGNNSISSSSRKFFSSVDFLTGVNNMDGAVNIDLLKNLVNQSDAENLFINRDLFVNKIIPYIAQSFSPRNKKIEENLASVLLFEFTDWSDPNDPIKLRDSAIDIMSDWTFFVGAIKTVMGHAKLNDSVTYFYELAADPPVHLVDTPSWINGSNHADDLPYVFGKPLSPVSAEFPNGTRYDEDVSRDIITMWTNFAKSGDPNVPEIVQPPLRDHWQRYDVTSQKYLKITNGMQGARIMERFQASRMAFWTELIPVILNPDSE